jgi:hypothetical protein
VSARLAGTLLALAGLIAAAAVIAGAPDLLAAWRFFAGGVPSLYEGEAVVAVLCWLVVLGAVIAALSMTLRGGGRRATQRSARGTLLLAAGIVLLGIALIRGALPPYTMCCGSDAAHVHEAIELVQR